MKRCFLAGLLCLFLSSGWAMAGELPSFPFVFVSGEAGKEVMPDKAIVGFGVEVFDASPDTALSTMEERSAELMAIFTKYGIENKDVIAYDINKQAVRQIKGIVGYELTRTMSVTVRVLDRFDGLMTDIVSLKNTTGIRTVFDTTKRKEIEVDLFREAAQKAREQADLLAKGFGTEVSSVHAISASQGGFGNIENEFGMGAGFRGYVAQAAGPLAKTVQVFVPNTIKLQESVSAIFRLK
ncbi:MAG TPA: SIMPL domain-containing protein [Syntrophorhabdales bacterium]|nr:SIMPL domain-containing protein [Syntrophorhabdales bacterium]